MKRVISIFLIVSMLFMLAACGGNANVEELPVAADDPLAEDREFLEGIGEVTVENGILTVSVTVPASLAGENLDQAQLDENAGKKYQSAKRNKDGSVTFKMTREQHGNMLADIRESVDQGIRDMLESADFNFREITYNANMSEFNATMETTELGMGDAFSVLTFYLYGGMYQIFCADKSESVIVNFYAPDGTLIDTADSAEMQ